MYIPPLVSILEAQRVVAADAPIHEDVIRGAADFVARELSPRAAAIDRDGCRLSENGVQVPDDLASAWKAFVAAGWPALSFPESYGGQNLPELTQCALSEMVNAACLPLGMLSLLGRAAAKTLIEHADESLKRVFVPRLATGEWTASICMTEPDAGSDAGALRTTAVEVSNGRYRLTGSKVFISFGDHALAPQIAHMVLARDPGGAAGTRGVSLFLVPSRQIDAVGVPGERNNVRVLRIEEKLGLHGSPTCALEFEGAEGYLVGELHGGFRTIFTMVNTMRLEVAIQGVGLASAATQQAIRYAGERIQGFSGDERRPVPILRHPDVRRMLMTMMAMTDACRVMVYETAACLDLAKHSSTPGERQSSRDLAAWLLPICKAVCTDAAVQAANLAIQVHGGYGYIRDTGVERLLRDARVMPIFEGTNGIQAIDLVTRKLLTNGEHAYSVLTRRVRIALSHANADLDDIYLLKELKMTLEAFEWCSVNLAERLEKNRRDGLAGATAYLDLAGRLALGWSLVRLCRHASNKSQSQRARALGRFFAVHVLSDARTIAERALAGVSVVDAMPDHLFLSAGF